MIISASRRTDIPALYAEWFMNRLKEGYALIPNPRNPNRISRINFSPANIDCIVFWTKNPIPMLEKLKQMDNMGYTYYMQVTITPYDQTIEPRLPLKEEILQSFIAMSKQIGNLRSVWRYDPIIIDANHSIEWHTEQFTKMCSTLSSYTKRCILSFIDPYKNTRTKFRIMTQSEMYAIASVFSRIAKKYDLSLYTCSEEIDLSQYGIAHSSCVDKSLIEKIIGCRLKTKKDANQRPACGCIESIDIGTYDTCTHGCTYCYATSSEKKIARQTMTHNPISPILVGYLNGNEMITESTSPSCKIKQISLLENENY